MTSLAALGVVIAFMLLELAISRRNERALLAQGAVRPPDPVYRLMQVGYPGVFVAMALEGLVRPMTGGLLVMGIAVFVAAKLFKFWAIATLGHRWTYTVLVLPGVPLVASGPYRFMRHPNYAGVIGELVGMALVTGAWITGPAGVVFFGVLLLVRVRAEERALHLY
jgi:methyltransferase